MVLEGRPSGRVGRRRISTKAAPVAHRTCRDGGAFAFSRRVGSVTGCLSCQAARYARSEEERAMANKRGTRRERPRGQQQDGGFGPYRKSERDRREPQSTGARARAERPAKARV